MKRPRVGMSLLEMMLALAISSALVSLLAITVSRMMQSNQRAHDHVQTVTNLGRLGEQFRRDVHAATAATLEGVRSPTTLSLTDSNNHRIVYEFVPGGIGRQSSDGDQVRQRELYLLPSYRPLAWQLDREHRELALSVGRLTRPDSDDSSVSGEFAIVAVLRNVQPTSSP